MKYFTNVQELQKLSNRTEYEAYFLKSVYELVEQPLLSSRPDVAIYPFNKSKPRFIKNAAGKSTPYNWRLDFLNAGSPLVFVTTYKLIDMLVEWILKGNKQEYSFRFAEKIKKLKKISALPPLLKQHSWLLERLVGLYETLEPFRGTIIHNESFSATNGNLTVSNSKKNQVEPPIEISADILRRFAHAVITVLKCIEGSWKFDKLQERYLSYILNEISFLHGHQQLDPKEPTHICVRKYCSCSEMDCIDLPSINSDIASKYKIYDWSFDLHLVIVSESTPSKAFFFPWDALSPDENEMSIPSPRHEYEKEIPNDINPEDLQP